MSTPSSLGARVAGWLTLAVAPEAWACPDCPTSRVVRSAVFDDRFWGNLAVLMLPLFILGVITVGLYRIGLERPRREERAVLPEVSR